jgi:4-aminobutyrate aminotransferase
MLELIEKLKPKMPSKSLDTFFFWNSGSEAVEAAIKLARHATKKQNIIVFQGSYHGRTIGTMSLTTSKTIYGAGYGPLMSGVHVAPFPYCHQCAVHKSSPDTYNISNCCNDPIRQLELVFKQRSAPSDTAAVIIEPVQGEGGYVVPPKGKYLFPKMVAYYSF